VKAGIDLIAFGCPTDVLEHDCKKERIGGYSFGIASISLCNGVKTEQQFFRYNNEDHEEGVIMKFFIDTANVDEIRKAHELGVIDGVTTNPSLMAKEGKDPLQILKEICTVVNGPVSAEVVGLTAAEMVREAVALAKIHENIVVKIPMIEEGVKAVKKLSGLGIRTNVTLVFSSTQALIAAKAGASYVSPFVGRLDDISHVGMDLIGDIIQMYENYLFATEVIVASIRNPLHVVEAAKIGAHIATIPYAVITQLIRHPLTDVGLAKFLKDWEKIPQKVTGKGKN
jgi:transaldolase